MKKVARVYIQRHGDKDGDKLSPLGIQQVVDSVITNLAGIEFHSLYASKKYRTLQTVVYAVGVLEGTNRGLGIETREGFDFIGAPDIDRWKEISAAVKELAGDKPATVAMWAQAAPVYVSHIRPRITAEILKVATETLQRTGNAEVNILVGCHGPLSELACLDMDTMPALQEADIVLYEIHITDFVDDDLRASIVASTHIPRGF
jgi:broad specificity phosphatase PhoE